MIGCVYRHIGFAAKLRLPISIVNAPFPAVNANRLPSCAAWRGVLSGTAAKHIPSRRLGASRARPIPFKATPIGSRHVRPNAIRVCTDAIRVCEGAIRVGTGAI
jgi:hypothetical protein